MRWTRHDGDELVCLGHILDIPTRRMIDGEIRILNGHISAINPLPDVPEEAPYYLPGFIDAHVHIESSMMVPAEFARIAVEHGTTGIITDPHEIGNVLGVEGIDFMIRSAGHVKFNFCFGAPSCVPSCGSDLETSGAVLDSKVIAELMQRDDIHFLAEMMNYPGVLAGDKEVMAKIDAALRAGKRVDGHAPGVVGEERKRYAAAGVTSDHECSTTDEGRECIEAGMMLQIREGSAAKNFERLIPLLREYPDKVMFCTDDCHPTDLVRGHIDRLVRRAMAQGYDIWDILTAACVNPVRHYGLNWGLLQVGDTADFISIDNLTPYFRIRKTYVRGVKVYSHNSYFKAIESQRKSIESQMSMLNDYPNRFVANPVSEEDIRLDITPGSRVHVIVAEDGSLLTGNEEILITGNPMIDSRSNWADVQKIVVYNRYTEGAKPVVGLIRGFGLKNGALAASIAHDCHNIVAIGSDDRQLLRALNRVIHMKGGQVAIAGEQMVSLPLPIAGLISPLNGHEVAFRSAELEETVREAGCPLHSPFITMAFMCLPVIPSLKITDKGLIDTERFEFIH